MTRLVCWLMSFVTMVMIGGCSKEIEKETEHPEEIIASELCPMLYGNIMDQFPEMRNNESNQFLLFDKKAEKQIRVFKETEVYVTYISEGAGYSNSFGWYAYDSSAVPSNASELELHVLFPNVNSKILTQGDMLKLGDGKFKGGTVIGFFLIIGGWENGAVNFNKLKLYSDFNFNPNGQQQHILYKEKDCGDIVLAFEDKVIGEGSDSDFNDILFTISDNPDNRDVKTFDLRNIIRM